MRLWWMVLVLLALAACGQAPNMESTRTEALRTFDVALPADEPQLPGIVASPASAGPQIAYTYTFAYTLADAQVGPAQQRATAACRQLGARNCLVVQSNYTRDPDAGGGASLKLLVDARLAQDFGRRLDGIATEAGGEAAERHVSAEDVTKQIIDTAARVRAKQALADRLFAIIRTANGKVADLVAAEQAYAQVQEDLDAARSNAAALRQRVAMSVVDVSYRSARSTGAWAPVTRATGGLADSFASSIAALVTFVVVAIPWALLLALIVWLIRRSGWRPRLRWPWQGTA